MLKLGNVAIGKLFMYDEAIFAVLPFDDNEGCYFNLCVASENDDYERGEKYALDELAEVVVINELKLKEMLNYC
jgi:hypothetical protein